MKGEQGVDVEVRDGFQEEETLSKDLSDKMERDGTKSSPMLPVPLQLPRQIMICSPTYENTQS